MNQPPGPGNTLVDHKHVVVLALQVCQVPHGRGGEVNFPTIVGRLGHLFITSIAQSSPLFIGSTLLAWRHMRRVILLSWK